MTSHDRSQARPPTVAFPRPLAEIMRDLDRLAPEHRLDVPEIATLLGVSETEIRRRIASGALPSIHGRTSVLALIRTVRLTAVRPRALGPHEIEE